MSFVHKPWGGFTYLKVTDRYWVKQMWVGGEHRISLQRHEKRTESWTVLRGEGIVQIGQNKFEVKSGASFSIPVNTWHRISNTGKESLSIIEVALGDCFEGDIERSEDDYGREKSS